MKKGGKLLFLAVLITLVLFSATTVKAADDFVSYLRDLFYYSNPQVYMASFWNWIFPSYTYCQEVCDEYSCTNTRYECNTNICAEYDETTGFCMRYDDECQDVCIEWGCTKSHQDCSDQTQTTCSCTVCSEITGMSGVWDCNYETYSGSQCPCTNQCTSSSDCGGDSSSSSSSTTAPPVSSGACPLEKQGTKDWGEKNGQCLPSCGLAGKEATGRDYSARCDANPCAAGETPVASYDCAFCCVLPQEIKCVCDDAGNPANNHFSCDGQVSYSYCPAGYACTIPKPTSWNYVNAPCQKATCTCDYPTSTELGKNSYTCGKYKSYCPFGSVCKAEGSWDYGNFPCETQKTDITCTCDIINNPEIGKNCYKCPSDSSKNGCCAAGEVCTKSSWKYGENPCQKTTCTCEHPDDIYYTAGQNSFVCNPGNYKSFCPSEPKKTICSAKTSWTYGNFPCTPASEKPKVDICKAWQTSPNWKEVNGECLPSCGHGGGASADCRQTACNSEKEENIKSWDCTAVGKYCCAQKGAPGIIGADCKKPEYNIKKGERCPSVLQGCTYCTCTDGSLTGQVGPGQLCCVASEKIVGQQFGAECAKDEKGKGVECPSQIKPGETCPKGCGDCWCVGGPVSCWTPAERTCCVEFLNGVQFCQPKAGGCGKDIGGGVTGLANCQINIGSGQITGKIPCQCGNKECSEKYCIDGKTCSAESGFGKITCECDYPGKTKIKTNKFTCTDSFGNQIIDGEHTACKEDDDCIGSTIFLKNSPQWPCYKKGTGPTDKPPLTECVNTGEVCGVLYKQTKRCCDSNDVCSGGIVMRCVNKKENCANTGVACMNLLVGVRSCCDENDECKRTSFFSSDCVKKVR